MCGLQCFLALLALSINVVNSWDIAVTNGDQLEFYTNQTKTNSDSVRLKNLTALAYDAVHNMLLFVAKQNDNASIFSYNITTKNIHPLVRRRLDENIQGLAFDPVSAKLFWTDADEKSIFWISLTPGSKNDIYGNLLIKMNDEIPAAIAVDSCRGYIYWTNTNITKPSIERARLDGTERSVIINTDIFMPVSLTIDQRTQKLYWADDREGIHFSIESSDLKGQNRKKIYSGTHHQPIALTVSVESIYWIDWGYKYIWKLSKTADGYMEPEEYATFYNEAHSIAANYQIADQTQGVEACKVFANITQTISAINDSFNIPHDAGVLCLHGVKIEDKMACKCSSGYTGSRCEINVCQNFCLNGDCDAQGDQPSCRCKPGFKGTRCEIDICQNHCLNSGTCSLDNEHQPTCKCIDNYRGERCEKFKVVENISRNVDLSSSNVPVREVVNETCNCTKVIAENISRSSLNSGDLGITDGVFVDAIACSSGWDSTRDPIIMVLAILCGLLCLACAIITTKLLKLMKRPRIKKRIIVNKNVTPLTARPDQCEITIENCCNMNICETPCFEPRNTIRPNLLESKPGKEEKRNLIANMETADDY